MLPSNYFKIKNRKKVKRSVAAGDYTSTVMDIGFHPDYIEEGAILVRYKLIDSDGEEYDYEETFLNDEKNPRTNSFFDYLEENNIKTENLTTFIGCTEKLKIRKQPKGSRIFLTISEREFINDELPNS